MMNCYYCRTVADQEYFCDGTCHNAIPEAISQKVAKPELHFRTSSSWH
jgi:hypothetical protein